MPLKLLSHVEQVTEYLRNEIKRGRWGESMPGGFALKDQLGTSHSTVELALKQLEKEGLLLAQGTGKKRRIVMPKNATRGTLRIAIFLYEPGDRKVDYQLDLLHRLREAGHSAYFTSKTLMDLDMDPKKIARFVGKNNADAWIVVAGSRSVLEWFAAQPFPTFGFFGRIVSLPIASTGPKKTPAIQTAVQRLVALGHRRIVFITRAERRKPVPGFVEKAFITELEAQGIPTGSYNLPDWQETRAGFTQALDSLFQHTPPTALLISTSLLTVATLQYFSKRGIQAPRDVSLISTDPDPIYDMSLDPSYASLGGQCFAWQG
jgi:DNA-binding transcriptional ArsR family regulator